MYYEKWQKVEGGYVNEEGMFMSDADAEKTEAQIEAMLEAGLEDEE